MKKSKRARRTSDGRVIVESRAYGEHTRAARGTYKKAELNDGMKASSAVLTEANTDAKLIKRELEQYIGNPRPTLLWQRLLSRIRAGFQNGKFHDPKKFEGFDLYEEHPISRQAPLRGFRNADKEEIRIAIGWSSPPKFKRKWVDGYLFGAIRIFVDPSNFHSEASEQYSENFTASSGECEFSFPNKLSNEYALVFLTLKATQNGLPCPEPSTSGFRCVFGIRLDSFREENQQN